MRSAASGAEGGMSLDNAYAGGRFDDPMEMPQIIDVTPVVEVVIGPGEERQVAGLLRQLAVSTR